MCFCNVIFAVGLCALAARRLRRAVVVSPFVRRASRIGGRRGARIKCFAVFGAPAKGGAKTRGISARAPVVAFLLLYFLWTF